MKFTCPLRNTERGLTLMELIIVMAIIAIIATGLYVNLISSVQRGRDSKRKQDLTAIAKALELYYNDNNAYPQVPLPYDDSLTHPANIDNIYMTKIPNDPQAPEKNYCYWSDGSFNYYLLLANLENQNDPDILQTPEYCPSDGLYYNFAVKSSNVR